MDLGRFCSDCQNYIANSHGEMGSKGICRATEKRKEKHFLERGKTPDSYWTAPANDIWPNSQYASRCVFFKGV